jgi:hypothetical protein
MNWKAWLYGLLSSVISAFATAASGALALPSVFSFTEDGFINMAKLAALPAIFAFFAYLKTHPLPDSSITVTTTQTIAKTGGDPQQ